MGQTVVVTGATGFLGSHLVKGLLKEGHHPIILKRRSSDTARIADVLPRVSCYDVGFDVDLNRVFEESGPVDAVFHVATNYGSGEALSEVVMANTLFPLRLLEAATASGTPVFFNTDSYFNSGDVPYEYKYLPAYSLSKKHFADWGSQAAEAERIRFVNIQLQHMFGPGDKDSKFTSSVFQSCLASKDLDLTPGEQERDFIYVEDVVSAYCALLQRAVVEGDWYQHYDLGTGHSVSIRHFVEEVHRLTKSNSLLRFGKLPYREHEIMHAQADISPLKRLGWQPAHSLKEGICQTIAWYRQRFGETGA